MPADMGPRDMAAPVDECEERLDDCGPNATCVDQASGFDCVCLLGFERASEDAPCEPLTPRYVWERPPWTTQGATQDSPGYLGRVARDADFHEMAMRSNGEIGLMWSSYDREPERSLLFVDEADVKNGLTRPSTVAADAASASFFDVGLLPSTGQWVAAYTVGNEEADPVRIQLRRRVAGAWEDWLAPFEFDLPDVEPSTPRLLFGAEGQVYLAVEAQEALETLYVHRWDGDGFQWEPLGPGPVQSGWVLIYDLVVDSLGRPVVAFTSKPNLDSGIIGVRRWVESEGWVRYSEDEPVNLLPNPTEGSPLRVRIRLAREDRPVVFWEVDRPDARPEFDFWTVFLEGITFEDGRWRSFPDMRESSLMGLFPRNPSLQLDFADRPLLFFMNDESRFNTFMGAYTLSDGRWRSTAAGESNFFIDGVWAGQPSVVSAYAVDPDTATERACVVHAGDSFSDELALYCSSRSLNP